MKSLFIFATLLAICLADTVAPCSVVNIQDVAVFDICAFQNAGPLTAELNEGLFTYDIDWSLVKPQVQDCSQDDQLVYGTISNLASLNCSVISETTDPIISAQDSSDADLGLIFTFPVNPSYGKHLVVNLTCDSAATDFTAQKYTATQNDTAVIVSGSSSAACPTYSLNMLYNFLEKYRIIFLIIFFILGVFICFFGFQTLKVTIFIIATVGVTFLCAVIFFTFTHLDTKRWILWVIFAACLIVGLIAGYLAVKFETLGFIALGLVLGGVGGLFLFNLVLAPFVQGKEYVLWILVGILAVIGGLVAWKVWKKVVVIATAVIGSYMMVRAVSVAIGGFPSEGSIASGVAHFSGVTYAYLVAMVIVAIAGAWVQFKRQGNSDDEDDQNAYERVMRGDGNYNGNYGGGNIRVYGSY